MRNLPACQHQHVRGGVDTDDGVAGRSQKGGVAAGAAGGIERAARWQLGEDLPDEGLVDSEEGITGFVVRLGPQAIAGHDVDLADLVALTQFTAVPRREDRSHLGKPVVDERGIELAGISAK